MLRKRGVDLRKLDDIEKRLRDLTEPLNDQSRGYEDIFELLEDLRETVLDYQKIQQTDIHDQEYNLITPDEAAVLDGFRFARKAEFRYSGHRGCLKGTREDVLDGIELWTRDPAKPPVYWLNGLAGTGKTTIAQTVAERVFACGQLGASFFCSRDFEDRSNIKLIFPTLAVQLARKYTDFRSYLVPLVRSDPGVADESLYNQMYKLIVRPLNKFNISPVIIIDALDECQDEEPASAVLSILGQFVSKIPEAKFFVTGRPEPRIREGFRLPMLAEVTDVFVLHEVEPSRVDNDIRLFFGHKFSDLARRRSLDDWPTKDQLDLLCERAGGLFVYAVATVKSIDKPSTNPRKQLNLLLQSPESSTREGKTRLTGNTTLDLLYTSILQEAFSDVNGPDNDPMVRSVLGAMILAANPLSPSTIAKVLGLDPEDVFPLLSLVQSHLIFQDQDIDFPVRPFHKSFFDFLIDPDRCTNQRFHVFPPEHHLQLSIGCLNLMDRTLDRNMCRLPDGVANSDVHDLKERIRKFINPALQYACRSWHSHLFEGPAVSLAAPQITSTLRRFLERQLLLWLEVLSVLGAVKNAVNALQAAVGLLKESPTFDLAHDCHRFVTGYFEIISASSPHIYHSALVLCPTTSIIRKLYKTHAQPFMRVVHGVPVSWDSNIAAIARPFPIYLAAWSSCNSFIATSPYSGMAVDILDAMTLQRLQSLKCPPEMENSAESGALIFSPDSHLLTWVGRSDQHVYIISWDLQTGGVVSAITHHNQKFYTMPNVTYSNDGKMIGVSYSYSSDFMISIYDVVSGIHMYNIQHDVHGGFHLPGGRILAVWTHGEFLRVATTEPEPITIWEVRFTPRANFTLVETLYVPDILNAAIVIAPTPLATYRIVLRRKHEFSVWDTGDSKFLLRQTNATSSSSFKFTFSSDSRSFVSWDTGSEVYIWKEHSTGYILHGKLKSGPEYSTPLLSPDGKSITAFGGFMLRLWHTENLPTTPSSPTPQHDEDFVLDFISDGPSAVVTRRKDNVIVVLDLESGLPQLTIDTGMEVYGLKVIGNTIAVIAEGEVVTWNALGRKSLLGTRMGPEGSTQTITFAQPLDDVLAAAISPDFRHIAVADIFQTHLHNLSDGQQFDFPKTLDNSLWFAPGDNTLWLANADMVCSLPISYEGYDVPESHNIEHAPRESPWRSSLGYEVTNDGWVLSPEGKRLLMLPPPWRSDASLRVWNGHFLALLHGSLPEPVILNFEP
ncbi:hypothetical protein BJ322DRAFT_780761 [Thelephora terrestris]|uniref:NACHT domain-containing protein n=1 Tax=Thelephora terrestris TaxID=56493 RepID=A0A9P6HG80_9AGAM|nr:hypothetical protein BJ322DRAFT_780761 [Thelephora terrestris]